MASHGCASLGICHQSLVAGDTPLVGQLTCIRTTDQTDDVQFNACHSMQKGRHALGGVGWMLGHVQVCPQFRPGRTARHARKFLMGNISCYKKTSLLRPYPLGYSHFFTLIWLLKRFQNEFSQRYSL